jgi:hypothetical protein
VKVISITRGKPAVRKLSIAHEKVLTDFFWETLCLLDVLRKRIGPVVADGIIELRRQCAADVAAQEQVPPTLEHDQFTL